MPDVQSDTGSATDLWTFDQRLLRPGDIVLERGHGKFSPLVTLIDRGRYSHVLLWLGGGDFLEAMGSGVRTIGFARVLVQDPDDWTVLRHSDADVGARAAVESRAMAHKRYDLWGAAMSPFPFARLDPTRLFCSQLVAAAYERAGHPLVASKSAHQVTPNTLIRDAGLEKVEPLPLSRIPSGREEAAAFLIDRNQAFQNSPTATEMRISQDVFALVRPMYPAFSPLAGSGLTSPPGNLYEAIALLLLLDEAAARPIADRMCDELGARGYYGLADQYLIDTANRRLIENARLAVGSLRGDELMRLAVHMRELEPGREEALARHEQNAAGYRQMLSQRRLRLFERLSEMHVRIVMHLQLIMRNEREILKGCERAISHS